MRGGVVRLRHYSNLQGLVWRWPRFRPIELADPESCELIVAPAFLDWLEGVRQIFGKPMIINDATRTPERQIRHSGRRTGSHVDGMAVDVKCHGADAHRLQRIAHSQGVLGLGTYLDPKKPIEKHFLHLDRWATAPPNVRPMAWSG